MICESNRFSFRDRIWFWWHKGQYCQKKTQGARRSLRNVRPYRAQTFSPTSDNHNSMQKKGACVKFVVAGNSLSGGDLQYLCLYITAIQHKLVNLQLQRVPVSPQKITKQSKLFPKRLNFPLERHKPPSKIFRVSQTKTQG